MGWTCFYDNVGLSIDDTMRREWNATGDNGAVFIYRASAKQLSKAIIVSEA